MLVKVATIRRYCLYSKGALKVWKLSSLRALYAPPPPIRGPNRANPASRNTPVSNYASVPANNNLKSRLVLSCAIHLLYHKPRLQVIVCGNCSVIRNWKFPKSTTIYKWETLHIIAGKFYRNCRFSNFCYMIIKTILNEPFGNFCNFCKQRRNSN